MNSLLKFRRPLSSSLTSLSLQRLSTTLHYVFEEKKEGTSFIHPTAIVHPNAVIGQGVSVGPLCTIGPSAKLGNGCQMHPSSHIFGNTELGSHCVLMTGAVVGDELPGHTVIGCNNIIGHHAVVGIKCQDMKYKGMNVFLMLGTTMRSENLLQSTDLQSHVIERLLVITISSWGLVILHMTAKLVTIIYLLIPLSWQDMSSWRTMCTLEELLLFINFVILAHFLSSVVDQWYDCIHDLHCKKMLIKPTSSVVHL